MKHKNILVVNYFNYFLMDCDYTIYNYKKSQKYALKKSLKYFSLKYKKGYEQLFNRINDECWAKYNNSNQYEKIRLERVRQFLLAIGQTNINYKEFLKKMELEMIKPFFMPGAIRILKLLKRKNKKVYVVTDADIRKRLEILKPLLDKGIIIKDNILGKENWGYSKKENDFFIKFEETYNNNPQDSIMIGDSFENDLKTAKTNKYATCLVNLGHKYKTGKYDIENVDKINYVVKTMKDIIKLKI